MSLVRYKSFIIHLLIRQHLPGTSKFEVQTLEAIIMSGNTKHNSPRYALRTWQEHKPLSSCEHLICKESRVNIQIISDKNRFYIVGRQRSDVQQFGVVVQRLWIIQIALKISLLLLVEIV